MLLIVFNLGPKIRVENFENLNRTIANCGVSKRSVICNYNGGGFDTVNKNLRGCTILNNKGDNIGNAKGLNNAIHYGLKHNPYISHIAVIADDIVMPSNWAIKAMQLDDHYKFGIMGFHCVQERGPEIVPKIYKPKRVFGCWVFSRMWIEKVGYFLDKMSNYGLWDAEYNRRVERAGGQNVYIGSSTHVGHMAEDPAYRRYKNEQLKKAAEYRRNNPEIDYYDPFA